MSVTVSPETFAMVKFDSGEIAAIAERLMRAIGLPDDLELHIDVDERTPLGRAVVASMDPLTISVESGALEDPKRPRELSDTGAADVLGRLLFRVKDRRDPAFGAPPGDDDVDLPLSAAWDAYCIGRLVRLGFRHYNNYQRRLYHFRNRHGFTDVADAAFEKLWAAESLTWADIEALSNNARAVLA